MPRTARKISEGNVYHVVIRGVSHHNIFENDHDRGRFMGTLREKASQTGCTIYAWCLMSNHVHLLLHADIAVVSEFMKRLQISYAVYFNLRYQRSGHLFQNRFDSEPIDTDEYLMTVVRYIHQNPLRAGIADTCDLPWTSYREYVSGEQYIDAAFVLAVFGGIEPFIAFHAAVGAESCLGEGGGRHVYSDEGAREIADAALGEGRLELLGTLDHVKRNQGIRLLHDQGISIRQIERLTGIGRGVIAKAVKG